MLIVSYDIESDRSRARFAKFLKKFGHRLQYSVYELKNSNRVLRNIMSEVELSYEKKFKMTDSVIVFSMCESCRKKIYRYGSAVHANDDVIIFD